VIFSEGEDERVLRAAQVLLEEGLLGMSKPLHVLVPSVTARGIVNLTALSVNQAASERARREA
jgi:phosphotransacetylase